MPRHRPLPRRWPLTLAALAACCSHAASSPLLNWAVLDDPTAWCHQLDALVANGRPSTWSTLQHLVAGNPQHAPSQRVEAWMSHKCAVGTWHKYLDAAPLPQCRGQGNRNVACELRSKLPTIAVLVGSTSRGVADPSVDTMGLFQVFLKSFVKTVECGFRYVVYVGYDAGDAFYDSDAGRSALADWFATHVHDPLAARGVHTHLRALRVANTPKKPGPVFNAVARQAHVDGADFFYRINDDTFMATPWAGHLVDALCQRPYPHGVAGPVESYHKSFLTHDFVHRAHLDMFDDYYPKELPAYYLDNWISWVYGRELSLRVTQAKVLHLIDTHGTRYIVDSSETDREKLVDGLVHRGRAIIADHLRARSGTMSDVVARSLHGNSTDLTEV